MKIKIKKKLKEVATAVGLQTYAGDRVGQSASALSQMPSGGEEITKANVDAASPKELADAVLEMFAGLPAPRDEHMQTLYEKVYAMAEQIAAK